MHSLDFGIYIHQRLRSAKTLNAKTCIHLTRKFDNSQNWQVTNDFIPKSISRGFLRYLCLPIHENTRLPTLQSVSIETARTTSIIG